MKIFRIGFQSYLDRINPFGFKMFKPIPYNKKCHCMELGCEGCQHIQKQFYNQRFSIYDYILGSIAFIKDSVHNFNAFIMNKNRLAKIGNKNDKV